MLGKLLVGIVGATVAYGAAKNAYQQHQEQRQAQIDQGIAAILALPADDAMRALIQVVPQMDASTWTLFHQRLDTRGTYDTDIPQSALLVSFQWFRCLSARLWCTVQALEEHGRRDAKPFR